MLFVFGFFFIPNFLKNFAARCVIKHCAVVVGESFSYFPDLGSTVLFLNIKGPLYRFYDFLPTNRLLHSLLSLAFENPILRYLRTLLVGCTRF